MTLDFTVLVNGGTAGGPGRAVDAATLQEITDLVASLPPGGSVALERVGNPADYALACSLPDGRFYVQHDDGQGDSDDTEAASAYEEALARARNRAEREFLEGRLRDLRGG